MMPVTRSLRKFKIAVYSVILLALSGCYDPYYVAGDGYQSSYGETVVSYRQPWYDYDYYPSIGVYFNYGTGYYYHHDHGRWNHVRRLPRHIRIHDYDRVRLRLHGDRPYLYHDEHRRKYKGYRKNDKHRYRDDRYRSEQKHDRRYRRDYKDERKHDKRDSRRRIKHGERDYRDERKHDKRGRRDENRGSKRGSRDLDNIDSHYFELYRKQNEKDQRRTKKKQERNRDERKHDKRSHRDGNSGSKRGSRDLDNIDSHYFELYKKQLNEEAQKRKEKQKKKKKQEQEQGQGRNRESEKNARNSGWYLQK